MRKLASIQTILDIQPIPDADKIEVATVQGWKIVIRKGEFKVGDPCVYFEIDSLIPRAPWNDFLADRLSEKKDQKAPIRLRTIKLRKQISQGLVMPLNILPMDIGEIEEGQDLTEILNIEKYEVPIPACLSGQVRGDLPGIVPITDETRIQSYPALIQEFQGEEVYWTIKIDGTSGTFVNIGGDHHVCSRKLSLLETEGNTYWKMYHKYGLKEILNAAGDIAIQGEVAGPSIQKNKLGLKDHELFVFNVLDLHDRKYFNYANLVEFCKTYNLQMVPVAKVEVFNIQSVDEIVQLATEVRYPNGRLGEGYVIRPVVERYSKALSGRASFKVINNKYLLDDGGGK